MKYWNYDRLAEVYDDTRLIPRNLNDFFVDEICKYLNNRFSSPHGLLSVGLGTGRIESLLSSRHFQLFGVDISSKMLKKLDSKKINPPCYLTLADGFSLPFVKPFQMILLIHIVHLIDNWVNLLTEIKNLCKILVVGHAYTETHDHPYFKKFLDIMKKNGWNHTNDDRPEFLDFHEFMLQQGYSSLKREMQANCSITNSQIYQGIKNRYYRSFWNIDEEIFNKSISDLDAFIAKNMIVKNENYNTQAFVKLTFYELD